MKIFILLFLSISLAFAILPQRNWKIITPGASSTTVVTPSASEYVVIKSILFSVLNASNMYFYYGAGITKVTPNMYFAAKGGMDKENVNILVPKGNALKVWFNTSPGCDMGIDYQLETDN